MTTFTAEANQRERMPIEIFPAAGAAARHLAGEIADLIRTNDTLGRPTVLGLATGSTPVGLYRELVQRHRETGLSFRNVVTFNLDEYYGLPRDHPESYWRFMHEQFFNHVDVAANHIHVPDGTIPRAEVFAWCERYERTIEAVGGIDLQVLGIGRTGHIGFNEPGSSRDSLTRLVTLDRLTRRDAARDFLGEANVPRHAITMGIGSIFRARRIVLLAWGEAKAGVIASATEAPPTDALPASLLQGHPAVRVLVDPAAASELTRCKRPWLVSPVTWTPALVRRAVTWLAPSVEKSVLKLLDEDYSEHGMADLLTEHGSAYGLNIRIFNELQHTITGWPGGKPKADDTHRPERAAPYPKRVLILSPEPADDVLGMGGTVRRLIEQGHDVTVVYLTSGNLAVPDEEALMVSGLLAELARTSDTPAPQGSALVAHDALRVAEKKTAGYHASSIRSLKSLIRRGEARASLAVCGLGAARIRFLDLPFYEKARYRQFRLDEIDVVTIAAVLHEIEPHQIFTTGCGDDPNTVAAVCFEGFRQAYLSFRAERWIQECRVWLFRSQGRDFEHPEIEMAVPLSPNELTVKVQAIYHHKSQRSCGPDEASVRESWQQAECRNRETARQYRQLGLADYEAIEAFDRWHPDPA